VPAAEAARCADRSAARDESLVGTASRFRAWLLIEQPGPWGHDALVQSDLPTDVGVRLRAQGHRLGVRILLIKRRERGRRDRRRIFAAYTGARDRRIQAGWVEDPEELLDLDLRALVRARFRGFGEPVGGPLFVVCTHGKHDPCCARRGAPLYRALAEMPTAWECTHVGGDRFAGNLVCFPHGLYYGRVTPEDAVDIVRAYTEGWVSLHHYRGRAPFPPAVQAAERWVRERHGILGVDDLAVVAHEEAEGGRHRVALDGPGGRFVVDVRVSAVPPELLTCKSTEPHTAHAFAVEPGRLTP
jgi:hypothetical protein